MLYASHLPLMRIVGVFREHPLPVEYPTLVQCGKIYKFGGTSLEGPLQLLIITITPERLQYSSGRLANGTCAPTRRPILVHDDLVDR